MADTPHLHVEFFTEPQEDLAQTRVHGRPIFKDVEMVRLRIVGDPKNTLIAPAQSSPSRDPNTGLPLTYAQKYPEHYRYFKDNRDQQTAAGTPLTEVPWLTAAKRAELKALSIFTVEGLAGLDGTLLQRIGMGARELKNKAQAWLDLAAGSAVESKMAGELAARDERIEALQQQMADMLATMQAGKAPVAATVEPEPEEPDVTGSPFANWQAEDIKNWIKEASGSRPAGNPSLKTLIAKADEINAALAEKNKAA